MKKDHTEVLMCLLCEGAKASAVSQSSSVIAMGSREQALT